MHGHRKLKVPLDTANDSSITISIPFDRPPKRISSLTLPLLSAPKGILNPPPPMLVTQNAGFGASSVRAASSWILSRAAAGRTLGSLAEGTGIFRNLPFQHQHIRTVKRGTEYQPKNIKRKRTHGWIKRISTRGGIEVILRRMLKGRKSLTH
ncbi:hypothetical protein JZ751_015504 [Albula glossodonta]|uniref:Large ribosomal subunit protein bL34m n=1 Tax=Albula glossodonta TaxID=121402 RepID=A0A8T2MX03_9TELE|nr:hypothetical protein JZ751_015504 [Albula glossodonta]